jgi:tRNA dimethylallyltransferase
MFAAGFVAEVAGLEDRLRAGRTAKRAVGYAELLTHLAGETSLEQARLATGASTRRLARKQLSWFRRDLTTTWLDASAPDLVAQAASAAAPRLES